MANLKEIRNRIASVTSTRKITNAMKMISAAKLRKAQNAIIQMRPFAERLHTILTNLSDSIRDEEDNPYSGERDLKKLLIVVITSNRGLCGAFNSFVIKRAVQLAHEDYGNLMRQKKLDFYAIGKKGSKFLQKNKYPLAGTRNELFDNLTFDNVIPVAEEIMNDFVAKKYDRVMLVYNQFKNAAVQILTTEQFLPILIPEKTEEDSILTDYIYEPSKEYIVRELIPRSLKIQFYKALLDSHAAEQGARMTAMHMATDNATELLREMNLNYNKARQASITNELLEIVSGAEALKE
ncbi:MAG: ATP synthase F1 subunit gamma [Desulfobacteraceae bacterium]|nr:ATP synthase F1 subunit gamma [Desulfobacteraceae bacterium]